MIECDKEWNQLQLKDFLLFYFTLSSFYIFMSAIFILKLDIFIRIAFNL